MMMRTVSWAVLVLVVSALSASTAVRAEEKPKAGHKAFGPFDAGDKRAVVRQGTKGKARARFPAVGDAAKVPGEGPPPPPLHADSEIPEGALDKAGGGPNAIGPGLSSNPLYLASLVYGSFITKIDGPRCTHLPTCSRFASQAVARHGVVGILMGLERVIQTNDSSSIRRLPEVEGWGGVRVYDPIENYEFWHTERYTGFPPPTSEQPLSLPPLASARASLTSSSLTSSSPSLTASSLPSTQPTVP